MKKQILTVALCLIVQLVNAQTTAPKNNLDSAIISINETVITENRLQSRLSQQNRNIQILDRKEIAALPVHNLQALLSYAAGVQIQQRGPFGSQADVSIDGGTFEQTLILVNGVKVLDAQTGHNTLNIPIPLAAIERIEVIHGPAARIYGINSLTGAINIVTRKPTQSEFVAQVNAGTSFKKDANQDLFNGRTVQVGGTTARKNIQQSLYGSHESGNGYRYNTDFRNNKLYYQAIAQTNKTDELTLSAGYVDNSFGANGFYAAPGDKDSQEIVKTALASLGYKAQLSENFTLTPRISYRYAYDDYRYYRYDLTKARSQHHGQTFNTELNGALNLGAGILGLGLEWRNEDIRSSNIGNHNRNNVGSYVEFKTERIKNLVLNVGSYVNVNSDFGWQVFPGIDMGYSLNADWKIVAQTGSGQRIPSFTDLYLNQRPGNIGNPDIQPEQSWQYEGGVKFNHGAWTGQAIYFHRSVSDFIDWVRVNTSVPWQPFNFNNRTQGISMSAKYRLTQEGAKAGLTAGISYNYLSPRIDGGKSGYLSKYAIESLRNQLIGSLQFSSHGFNATATARYSERISHKNYFVGDLRVGYDQKVWGIYADAQNIFDVTYIEAAAIPMPGRWVSLGLHLAMKD